MRCPIQSYQLRICLFAAILALLQKAELKYSMPFFKTKMKYKELICNTFARIILFQQSIFYFENQKIINIPMQI